MSICLDFWLYCTLKVIQSKMCIWREMRRQQKNIDMPRKRWIWSKMFHDQLYGILLKICEKIKWERKRERGRPWWCCCWWWMMTKCKKWKRNEKALGKFSDIKWFNSKCHFKKIMLNFIYVVASSHI